MKRRRETNPTRYKRPNYTKKSHLTNKWSLSSFEPQFVGHQWLLTATFKQPHTLLQASSFTPQPKENISATVANLLSANSNKLLKLSFKDLPSNQGSFQNRVEDSSPTFRQILSSSRPQSISPTPSLILFTVCQRTDPPPLPTHNFPPFLHVTLT